MTHPFTDKLWKKNIKTSIYSRFSQNLIQRSDLIRLHTPPVSAFPRTVVPRANAGAKARQRDGTIESEFGKASVQHPNDGWWLIIDQWELEW